MKCVCLAENLYLTVYIYRFPDLCIDSLDDDGSLPDLCPASDDESDDDEQKCMREDRITEVCGNKYQPSKDAFDLPAPDGVKMALASEPAYIIYDNSCKTLTWVLDKYIPITEVCGNKYQPSQDVFDLPAPAYIIYDNACNWNKHPHNVLYIVDEFIMSCLNTYIRELNPYNVLPLSL